MRLNRDKFVCKLIEEMIKSKREEVEIDKIMSFIEDMLQQFDKESEEDHEMNQNFIGM